MAGAQSWPQVQMLVEYTGHSDHFADLNKNGFVQELNYYCSHFEDENRSRNVFLEKADGVLQWHWS